MTATYVTDHEALELALRDWIEQTGGLPAGSTRWVDQVAVRQPTPCATMQIISDGAMEGIDAEHSLYNAGTELLDTVTHGPRRMTVQVTVYTTPGAEDIAGRSARVRLIGALASLRSQSMKDLMSGAGLAFLQVLSAPRAVDEQLGDRWERRMQADVEFGYTSLVTDEVTWIETNDDLNITALE